MLILFIVLFSVVTTLSNFLATFLLISPKIFEIFTPNFTTKKSEKYDLSQWVGKKIGG